MVAPACYDLRVVIWFLCAKESMLAQNYQELCLVCEATGMSEAKVRQWCWNSKRGKTWTHLHQVHDEERSGCLNIQSGETGQQTDEKLWSVRLLTKFYYSWNYHLGLGWIGGSIQLLTISAPAHEILMLDDSIPRRRTSLQRGWGS